MYAYGVYLSDIIIRAVGQYLSAAALCGEIHIYTHDRGTARTAERY